MARTSSPPNKRTGEFQGGRPVPQAARPRSGVPWRDCPSQQSELPGLDGALRLRSGQAPPCHRTRTRYDSQTREAVTLAMGARASLAFARTGFYFDGDHRLIVERIHPSGVLGHRFEDLVYDAARRLVGAAGDDRGHALRPHRMAVPVACVENTVAVEDEQIARL